MRSIDIGRIQGIYVWNLATHFGMLSPRRHNQTGPSAKSESGNIMHHTPNPIWALPFLTILGAIATLPLIHKTAHAWEKNQNKFLLSVILSLITLGYYGIREFGFHDAAPGAASVQAVLDHADDQACFADELRANQSFSYDCIFHLSGLKYRWIVNSDWRPTAVFGIPSRRAIFVDIKTVSVLGRLFGDSFGGLLGVGLDDLSQRALPGLSCR